MSDGVETGGRGPTLDGEREVLLVSPASRAFNHYRPPMALMLLAGYLKKNGIRARIVDVTTKDQIRDREFEKNHDRHLAALEDEVVRRVAASRADIIGIGCYTPEFMEVDRLARRIRAARPGARLVAGGIHPTFYPEHFAGPDSPFDFAVIGEGEVTLLELVRAIRAGKEDFHAVAGISYFSRTEQRPVVTSVRAVAESLDEIVCPDYDDLDMDYYTTAAPYAIRGVFLRSFYLSSARGCPSSCTFCVSRRLRDYHGARHFTRMRSPAALVKDIRFLRDRYAIDGFYFIDDLFTLRREPLLEFCSLLRAEGLRMVWGCSSKVNTVDAEMLRAMKEAGCVQVDFGVEKGSDRALKELKKGITVDQIVRTFDACRSLGLRTFANFLINTPGETEEDLRDIRGLLARIRPTIVSVNMFIPFPGCEIYETRCPEFTKEEYPLLMEDPQVLLTQRAERFRFAAHNVDLSAWGRAVMREYNRVAPNLAIWADSRYVRSLCGSSRKGDYVRQSVALCREFANQKF